MGAPARVRQGRLTVAQQYFLSSTNQCFVYLTQRALQALKTIEKKGLQVMAKEAGLDLEKLPYEDVRKARTEWLAQQPKHPPQVSGRVLFCMCKLLAKYKASWRVLCSRAETQQYLRVCAKFGCLAAATQVDWQLTADEEP